VQAISPRRHDKNRSAASFLLGRSVKNNSGCASLSKIKDTACLFLSFPGKIFLFLYCFLISDDARKLADKVFTLPTTLGSSQTKFLRFRRRSEACRRSFCTSDDARKLANEVFMLPTTLGSATITHLLPKWKKNRKIMTVNPAQARNEAHFQPDFLNGSGTKPVFSTGFFLLFTKKNLFVTGFRVPPAGEKLPAQRFAPSSPCFSHKWNVVLHATQGGPPVSVPLPCSGKIITRI
jgi:hypothetical protein